MWSIDGTEWDIPCTVERTAEMESSKISGTLLDKSYFNDVLGTYLKYSLKIAVPFGMEDDYASIYEVLTEPVDGHEFVLPYANGVITVTGRVERVKDTYMEMTDGTHWRGISFEVIANHPTKTMDLETVLTRGVTPLPEESDISVDSVYEYSANGWEELSSAEDATY